MDPARRAVNSMSRKEGEFTLLLDAQFDILWHSDSLSRILGWGDLRGRNGTDFVHPDDLGPVAETMMQFGGGPAHQSLDPAMGPAPAPIRVVDVNGNCHSCETTTWNHLDDCPLRGVLPACAR